MYHLINKVVLWRKSAIYSFLRLARAEATDRNNPLRACRCCLWAKSKMAANAMETDDLGHLPSNTLRRSNSAPNVSAAVMSEAIPIFQPIHTSRQRRFSTSQMAVNVVSKNSANKCQRTFIDSLDLVPFLWSMIWLSTAFIRFLGISRVKNRADQTSEYNVSGTWL